MDTGIENSHVRHAMAERAGAVHCGSIGSANPGGGFSGSSGLAAIAETSSARIEGGNFDRIGFVAAMDPG